MKVIVVGAGIGGLSAGIALQNLGHEVTIYERVTEIKPVGAAISVWSNGVKCLNYLGLGKQIAALGGNMASMAYMDGLKGDVMTQFSLAPLIETLGQKPYPVSRAELQLMLMREFGLNNIHLGKNVSDIEDKDGVVTAHFSDGSQDTGDLLIGSDGAKSMVRDYVREVPTVREYSGYVNWNGLVDIETQQAPDNQWTTYVEQGKRVSFMPIAGNRFYFFFDVPIEAGLENNKDSYREELLSHFEGWAEPVQNLINTLDVNTTNRVEIYDVEPFSNWVKGNVILLGDSAHNTSPDIGQGGCLAMEDGITLAMCFGAHNLSVHDTCKRYESLRVDRAKELVLRARKRSEVTHAKNPEVTEQWYKELRQESGEGIMKGIMSNIVGGPFG